MHVCGSSVQRLIPSFWRGNFHGDLPWESLSPLRFCRHVGWCSRVERWEQERISCRRTARPSTVSSKCPKGPNPGLSIWKGFSYAQALLTMLAQLFCKYTVYFMCLFWLCMLSNPSSSDLLIIQGAMANYLSSHLLGIWTRDMGSRDSAA